MYKNILVLLLSVVLLASNYFSYIQEKRFQVHFLDVGQGDSILLVTPDKKYVLIDGGPRTEVIEELAKILPFWQNKLDFVVATHGDADHIIGLVEVFERYKIENFVYNGEQKQTLVYKRLMDGVEREGSKVLKATESTDFVIGCCLLIDTLWPKSGFDESLGSNDSSVSILASYKQFDVYLAGDLSSEYESAMVKEINKDIELHKASHHGSRTSTSTELINSLKPDISVISAGLDNRYNHPHKEIIDILSENKVKVYRTDLHGTISVYSDGSHFEVKTERGYNK